MKAQQLLFDGYFQKAMTIFKKTILALEMKDS